jgi:hypothetical protein
MQKGRFTAPISGVYSLSMTVLQNDKKIPTFVSMIESRSKRLCTITTQSNYATAGCHVNARLEANSYIEVQLLKGELFGHPFMFSTFTGNLIGR